MLIAGFVSGILAGISLSVFFSSLDNGNVGNIFGAGFVTTVFIALFVYLLIKEKGERQKYWERIRKYYQTHPSASLSHVLPLLNLETDRDLAELLTKVWGLSLDEIQLINTRMDESLKSKDIKLRTVDRVKLYEGIDKLLKEFLTTRR